MNMTLLRALVALVPAGMLLVGSAVLLTRRSRLPALLQLLGAGGIGLVVLTHLCEALHLFPGMRWGAEDSVGHYLDLGSALCGLTLFPIGYLLDALAQRGR
jgi:hypothetical protein